MTGRKNFRFTEEQLDRLNELLALENDIRADLAADHRLLYKPLTMTALINLLVEDRLRQRYLDQQS